MSRNHFQLLAKLKCVTITVVLDTFLRMTSILNALNYCRPEAFSGWLYAEGNNMTAVSMFSSMFSSNIYSKTRLIHRQI
jgi:hypothetical protein